MAFVLVVLFVKGQATLSAAYLLRLLSIINSHSHYYYHNNFPSLEKKIQFTSNGFGDDASLTQKGEHCDRDNES
jgi:hypothetical protein